MLDNPISTSNYLPDCIPWRHSLLTWNKNSLFNLTLSDGDISKILKTITKTKQNPSICAIDTGRESVFPESTWQEFYALKGSPTSTLRAQARLTLGWDNDPKSVRWSNNSWFSSSGFKSLMNSKLSPWPVFPKIRLSQYMLHNSCQICMLPVLLATNLNYLLFYINRCLMFFFNFLLPTDCWEKYQQPQIYR